MGGLDDVQTLRARVEGKQQNIDIITLLELSEIALRGKGGGVRGRGEESGVGGRGRSQEQGEESGVGGRGEELGKRSQGVRGRGRGSGKEKKSQE